MARRIIGTNEKGIRVGESHHNAKLTDAECELIRQLYDEGGWSYLGLAKKFDVDRSTIRDIVKFRRRGQAPTNWRCA